MLLKRCQPNAQLEEESICYGNTLQLVTFCFHGKLIAEVLLQSRAIHFPPESCSREVPQARSNCNHNNHSRDVLAASCQACIPAPAAATTRARCPPVAAPAATPRATSAALPITFGAGHGQRPEALRVVKLARLLRRRRAAHDGWRRHGRQGRERAESQGT